MAKNKYYPQIQKAIGLIGDRIGNEHQMIRMFVDLRALDDQAIIGYEETVERMLKQAASITNVPESEILNATHEDVEAGGEQGCVDPEPD